MLRLLCRTIRLNEDVAMHNADKSPVQLPDPSIVLMQASIAGRDCSVGAFGSSGSMRVRISEP